MVAWGPYVESNHDLLVRTERSCPLNDRDMEHVAGVEPASSRWKREIMAVIRHVLAPTEGVEPSSSVLEAELYPIHIDMVGMQGIEPCRCGLRVRFSAIENHTHGASRRSRTFIHRFEGGHSVR